MGETNKPVGATEIANEVTDPRRRRRMLTVMLSNLETCRTAQNDAETSKTSTTDIVTRRFGALAVLLVRIIRDSDLAEDEVKQSKKTLKSVMRKEWMEGVDKLSVEPKRALFLTLLDHLNRLCSMVAHIHVTGGGINDPSVILLSRDFAEESAKLLLASGVSEEEKRVLFFSQKADFRPHEATATEAGAQVLCKILRESHLAKHELKTACNLLMKQMRRQYDDTSGFLETLEYTFSALRKRIPTD